MKQQPPKSRKRKTKSAQIEGKKIKTNSVGEDGDKKVLNVTGKQKNPLPTVVQHNDLTLAGMAELYPVLKDKELVKRFLGVTMTNNQKGRIRQLLKDNLKDTSGYLHPDVIHNSIQAILKSSKNLTDSELRKLRILYNMLLTAAKTIPPTVIKNDKKVIVNGKPVIVKEEPVIEKEEPIIVKEKKVTVEGTREQKVKGPKRYVVFIGNLPLGVEKEKIMQHFSALGDRVKSLRIPRQDEGSKSAIAYLEVADDRSYELALSKHHSMFENKRINVLYTTQQKTKISKTEAKGKSAKLVAMQKSGKLLGSVPLNRKRSARRKKMKAAQKKLAQEAA